jgi:hypothetical protein
MAKNSSIVIATDYQISQCYIFNIRRHQFGYALVIFPEISRNV